MAMERTLDKILDTTLKTFLQVQKKLGQYGRFSKTKNCY